jgi:tetratricopeptide (TPR) repeat protein
MKKIGEAYIKTHAYSKAARYYEAILKAEPQSELRYVSEIVGLVVCDGFDRSRINLADLLSKSNQIEQARSILDTILKEESNITRA